MPTALVVHGHFYQPPRENPWTGEVDAEPGADPHANWNERIFHECYRPNARARILDDFGRLLRIVNNYAHISFNFGPTLMSWMETQYPQVYHWILEADRESVLRRRGHGNAIAQAYNHTILPLLNERDLRTQIRWGLADFTHRFRRPPESMWLPETAASHAVLDALIDTELRYVILSPHQVARVRTLGTETWEAKNGTTVDTGVPYAYRHRDGSGRQIAVFFYDGPRSQAIAFEGVLSSSQAFIRNFSHAYGGDGRIVSIATDGESYGHHTTYGDRSLAHAMLAEAHDQGFWVTNYGEFLDDHAPQMEVELQHGPDGLGSSWSCAHGVGRWFRDCGCHAGGGEGWNQAWRTPLRKSLDKLRDRSAALFATLGAEIFHDPWAARDAYIHVLLNPSQQKVKFLSKHLRGEKSSSERALKLLETQKHAMLMYTSCGWFFSDLSGIETVQLLRYAGKVVEHLEELGDHQAEAEFLAELEKAKSNHREQGTGADLYRRAIASSRVTPRRVAAHLAIGGLVEDSAEEGEVAGYAFAQQDLRREQFGSVTLMTSRITLRHLPTDSTSHHAVAALHFGGVDFHATVHANGDTEAFARSAERIWKAFPTATVPVLLRIAGEEFGDEGFGLEHTLPGAQERISESVFGQLVRRFSEQYAYLYEESRRTLGMLRSAGFRLPRELLAAAEFTLGRRLEDEIIRQEESEDPSAYEQGILLAEEIAKQDYRIDTHNASESFQRLIARTVKAGLHDQSETKLESAAALIEVSQRLGLKTNLTEAQELLYRALVAQKVPVTPSIRELAAHLRIAPGLLENRAEPEL